MTPGESKSFKDQNSKLKVGGELPIVSRLLFAAKAAGVNEGKADRIVNRVLSAQQKLEDTFTTLNRNQTLEIATNSANNDKEIGLIIAQAVKESWQGGCSNDRGIEVYGDNSRSCRRHAVRPWLHLALF